MSDIWLLPFKYLKIRGLKLGHVFDQTLALPKCQALKNILQLFAADVRLIHHLIRNFLEILNEI